MKWTFRVFKGISVLKTCCLSPLTSYRRFLTPLQFLLLQQCFPLKVIGYLFNYRDFLFFWQNIFKVVCCVIVIWGKRLTLPTYRCFLMSLQETNFEKNYGKMRNCSSPYATMFPSLINNYTFIYKDFPCLP